MTKGFKYTFYILLFQKAIQPCNIQLLQIYMTKWPYCSICQQRLVNQRIVFL